MAVVQVFQNTDEEVGLYQTKVKSHTDVLECALADRWMYDDILRKTVEQQMHLKIHFIAGFFKICLTLK